MASKGIWGVSPSVEVLVGTSKTHYTEGEAVQAIVSLRRPTGNLRSVVVNVSMVDPAGDTLPGGELLFDLPAGVDVQGKLNITLPPTTLSGSFLLTARAESGAPLGMGSGRFNYIGGNGTLRGRVLDLVTNTTIPGAEVRLEGLGRVFTAQSDDGGNFSLDVPGTYYKVRTSIEGYNTARVSVAVPPHLSTTQDLFTTPAANGTLVMGQQGAAGKVLTMIGREPIPGARVGVVLGAVEICTESDREGNYAIVLPSGRWWLTASLGGLESPAAEVVVFSGRAAGLDLYVKGSIQQGRVLDLVYLAPIPGARILIDGGDEFIADAEGRFSAPLTFGYHTMALSAVGYAGITVNEVVSYRTSPRTYYLVPSTNMTFGQVRDLVYNTSIPGASLSFDGEKNITADADGRFSVVLSTGLHSVTASAADYESSISSILVAERSSPYNIYLMPLTSSASGVVRDLIHELPVEGAELSFSGAVNTTTAADGSYSVRLATGYHSVRVLHPSFAVLTTDIHLSARSSVYDFYLQPPASNQSFANGTVRDTVYNTTLAGVNVTFDDDLSVFTDSSGRYSTPIDTGFHTVSLALPGYQGLTTTIHVAGRTSPYDLYLMPSERTIGGRVLDLNETMGISGTNLSFDGNTNVTTNASGNFSVTLSTGVHTLTVEGTGFETLVTQVHISARSDNLTFLLRPAGYLPPQNTGNLTGHIYDLVSGAPLEGAWVDWYGHNGPHTDANGSYLWKGMSAGDDDLHLTLTGYQAVGWYKPRVFPGRTSELDFYMLPSPMVYSPVLTGRVRDLATGAPLNATVKSGELSQATDIKGDFRLALSSSTVSLTASAPGYDNMTVELHLPITGEAVYDVWLPLSAGNGTLKLQVVDSRTGSGVGGASVWLYSGYPEPQELSFETDSTGDVEAVLPSRTYALEVAADGYDTLEANLTCYADSATERKLYLHRSGDRILVPAELELVSLPRDTRYYLGDLAELRIRMRNLGDVLGETVVNLTVPGIHQELRTGWIPPQSEGDVVFEFVLPDDLVEKEYRAIYTIDGTRYEQRILVWGMNVSVKASLDKPVYPVGGTARLTLDVSNLKDFDVSLFSRVKYGDFDAVTPFNLTAQGNTTLHFDVPAGNLTGEKLFYSVYAASGRSLHINSLYVRTRPAGEIVVSTDRQLYRPGDEMIVAVESGTRGTIDVWTSWFTGALDLNATTTLGIPVPPLASGTYLIFCSRGER